MNIALWVIQILLATAFFMAGLMKATRPREALASNMGWVEEVPPGSLKLIGGLEVSAALGLVLPAATGILTFLMPVAAQGLALIMAGAIITHLRREEYAAIGFNAILMILALFVAYGRLVVAPL